MKSRQITFTVNSASPTITSAVLSIHNVAKLDCTVSGAVVTTPVVSAAATAKWPVGVHEWDLKTVIGGVTSKYLRGTIEVLQSE